MNELIPFGGIILAAAVAAVVLYVRLSSHRTEFEASVDWWLDFDPARYAPMERLLDEGDIRFVRSERGYDARIEKDLRRRRNKIFRAYLSDLVVDFQRLQMVGKLMVMAGGSAMLREQLFLHHLAFTRALFRVRVQLLLASAGIHCVDASALIETLRSASNAMHAAVPVPTAA